MGDVGQDRWEEVNIVQAGKSYGWGSMEGYVCGVASCAAFTPPVHAYPSSGASVIGGVVYRGKAMPGRKPAKSFSDPRA